MSSSRPIDRKPPKTYLTIRSCASAIIEAMQNGTEPKLNYNGATIREAYKLLLFERIIRRQNDYSLTETGKAHIAKNGFAIYRKKEEEK